MDFVVIQKDLIFSWMVIVNNLTLLVRLRRRSFWSLADCGMYLVSFETFS